ncbi:MAG: hypothetical protein JXR25_11335 [Pontiellaceae bacterium]|nr:hypothetical protein [Pontiellaceae bacterium]
MDGKFIGETVGVLTLADHETGVPAAMVPCTKKKAMAKGANSKMPASTLANTRAKIGAGGLCYRFAHQLHIRR